MFKEASPPIEGVFLQQVVRAERDWTPALPVVELGAAAQPLG